jgi:glyoxylase-like metal-dependent hydrolase (beta-lactamase superfamily II)
MAAGRRLCDHRRLTWHSEIDMEHGITAIDTGFFRPLFDASHLIVERGRAAFVDVGTNQSLPLLLDALQRQGMAREAVDWIILTHVHLDHAGGAGELLRHLPNARVWLHPRGVRHMVDPAQLMAGATAVYGAEVVQRTYGTLVPIAPDRIVEARDGDVIELAGRPLRALDTPGHARHHISIWDEASRAIFPGDTFGLSYREFDGPNGPFILPTTSPVQFEPDALRASIERMLAFDPLAMVLTHYSRIGDVARLGAGLIEQIAAMTAISRAVDGLADRHERMKAGLADLYVARAAAHGCGLPETQVRELLAMDIELNAQGLGIWLDRGRRED